MTHAVGVSGVGGFTVVEQDTAILASDLPYVITAQATEPTPVAGRLNLWIDTSSL